MCRRDAPKMHSSAWKVCYIHRYEWHREWLDHGREVLAALYRGGNKELPP